VDAAEAADSVPWTGVTGKPTSFTPATHSHAISQVTGLQAALDAKAGLASPALTGTPTAPTATTGTNTTQIASTAFVQAAIAALVDAAPGALDTLNELAAALGDDPSFATTVTNGLAGKLAAASNLSDLPNKATARSNLGLGSMATQAASNVAIAGGSITGVTLDGGTFGHQRRCRSQGHRYQRLAAVGRLTQAQPSARLSFRAARPAARNPNPPLPSHEAMKETARWPVSSA